MSRAETARNLALAVVAPLVALVWVEGCASTLIAFRAALDLGDGPAIRRHDPTLGWVSLPSVSEPDLWGPGRDLTTNARGFRGRAEVEAAVPPGRVRVVCSGDSFAFGEGVGDRHTWCHRLSLLDPRIEAVNLGQSGYGVDQVHLRYGRDAAPLEVDLHVFSFIGPDLARAGTAHFSGFAKPFYRLEGDTLQLDGVPVPETGPRLRRMLLGWIETLRTSEFLRRGRKKLFGHRRTRAGEAIAGIGPLAERIFQDAARVAGDAGTDIVFVYLPLQSEVEKDGRWRGFVRESFADTGLPFVDLTDALRAEDRESAYELFIPDGAAGGGHYSIRGHAWVAERLYDALRPHLEARGR